MVPPFALLSAVAFWRRRLPVAAHVVFALHFYAFWLLLFCMIVPIVSVPIIIWNLITGTPLTPAALDRLVFWLVTLIATTYLAMAIRRVLDEGVVSRIMKAAALALLASASLVGYRFVVFLITVYTTGVE
jgi:hypothetical protein